MTQGLDPKRQKNAGINPLSPERPTSIKTDDLIGNKFDGSGNPDQGENYDYGNLDGVNRYPRETGSDTAAEYAEGDFSG